MSGWWLLAIVAAAVALVAFGFVLGWQHRGFMERLDEWHRELTG